MATIRWPDSYEDLLRRGTKYWQTGQFREAEVDYLRAASLAPERMGEDTALEFAYEAHARAEAEKRLK